MYGLISEIQRFHNPWTIEILNQKEQYWISFCHDAPITLGDAESRIDELKATHPDAIFRTVPWFNSEQSQVIQRERELSNQLAAALETNLVFVDPGTNAAARIRAALAQHAAARGAARKAGLNVG